MNAPVDAGETLRTALARMTDLYVSEAIRSSRLSHALQCAVDGDSLAVEQMTRAVEAEEAKRNGQALSDEDLEAIAAAPLDDTDPLWAGSPERLLRDVLREVDVQGPALEMARVYIDAVDRARAQHHRVRREHQPKRPCLGCKTPCLSGDTWCSSCIAAGKEEF